MPATMRLDQTIVGKANFAHPPGGSFTGTFAFGTVQAFDDGSFKVTPTSPGSGPVTITASDGSHATDTLTVTAPQPQTGTITWDAPTPV